MYLFFHEIKIFFHKKIELNTRILTLAGTEYLSDSPDSKRCSSLNRILSFFQGSNVRIRTLGGKDCVRPELCNNIS